jgi:hypothetical protein
VHLPLAARSPDQQFEFDTAMWFGAIHEPGGYSWKSMVLCRLFYILHQGGLMCRRENFWIPWCAMRAPICSSICHGARVLICLPDSSGEAWAWIWAGQTPETRLAASHGIEPLPETTDISETHCVMKGIREIKKDRNVEHYGFNIALGGNGYMNPISGIKIDAHGQHGHLYMAYYRTSGAGNRSAILVNCEQSAPPDRVDIPVFPGQAPKTKNMVAAAIKGVPDQYGGGHGVDAKHSRFGATGGDDFSYVKKGELWPTQLGAYGPARDCYYDGMYLDLSTFRFTHIRNTFDAMWDIKMLGQYGLPPKRPIARSPHKPPLPSGAPPRATT